MEFRQYASSSKGNLYTMTADKRVAIIDPGLAMSHILRCRIALADCEVWRSHSHMDHSRAYHDLRQRYVLPDSVPVQTWDMQHDVPCQAARWVESSSGESLVFAIDTGSFDNLPPQSATIFALECNYQEEYLERDHTTLRVRQNHASLQQVIDYLAQCDLSDTQEIHLLHLSSRHADTVQCARAVMQATAIPVRVIGG